MRFICVLSLTVIVIKVVNSPLKVALHNLFVWSVARLTYFLVQIYAINTRLRHQIKFCFGCPTVYNEQDFITGICK